MNGQSIFSTSSATHSSLLQQTSSLFSSANYGYSEGWCFCLGGTSNLDKRRISESTPLLSVQYSNRDYCEKVPRSVGNGKIC